jgi:CTP:phosphocholine cytidylyltransferase-like protein
MRLLTKPHMDELLGYFADFITKINRKKTGNWTIKFKKDEVLVICNIDTRDFVEVPTCSGILALWNTRHSDQRLKMIENYCVEDEDRYTKCYWKLEWM